MHQAFSVGAILLQDQGKGLQPCAYLSHKLTQAEKKYATHEQELLAIIHALKVWRPYLEGAEFKVNSDHKALEVLATQPKLSRRQASWVEYLQAYDCKVRYVEGSGNHADALSRRPDMAMTSVNHLGAVWDASNDGGQQPLARQLCCAHAGGTMQSVSILETDDSFLALVKQLMSTKREQRTISNRSLRREEGLAFRGRVLYVPRKLRLHITREAHNPSYSGHLGVEKTYTSIGRRFWWPQLRKSVRRFVQNCADCQKSKPRHTKAYGLMQPIPPPSRPWQQITMDLITALPTTGRGHEALLVFVDRLTKTIRCVPTTKKIGAAETARLFKEHIFRHYGLPEVIIADRDPRWNSQFWRAVFQSLGTHTRLSTAYHPLTDGQTERANRTLEEMLRSYVHPFGDNWDDRVGELEFAYNNSEQKSTGNSPFFLLHGFHPRVPIDLYNPHTVEETPAAIDFVEQMLHAHQAAAASLEQASARQKQDYDKKRTRSSFTFGDWVYLSSEHYKFQGRTDKLTHRFLGPFRIVA